MAPWKGYLTPFSPSLPASLAIHGLNSGGNSDGLDSSLIQNAAGRGNADLHLLQVLGSCHVPTRKAADLGRHEV